MTPSQNQTQQTRRTLPTKPRDTALAVEGLDGTLPRFSMIGVDSGLDFQRFDDISGRRRIFETNGGGIALIDYDRDGWVDLFLTNGCQAPFIPNDRRTPSALFRNLGQLSFSDSTQPATLSQYGYATGCAVGDYDSDGFDDLYVTAFGRNTMWFNNGDGTFEDRTIASGTSAPAWSSSAAFSDLNFDGVLDLYVVNYLDESDTDPRLCPNPASPDGFAGCSPSLFEGVSDVLLMGDGQGGFDDASVSAGLEHLPGKGLGVVISDLDFDGDQEIYVANDGEANFLFVQQHNASADGVERDRHWRELALASGLALNERGHAQASMGIAAGDLDANGTIDLFLTHFYGDTNTLYFNSGELNFHEVTRGSGLGASSRQSLGFGTAFLDFDNDGWLDLFVANGHVDDRTWMAGGEPYHMTPQMYRNERNHTFLDVSSQSGEYFRRTWIGRGVACGDLDRDGRIDLAVSHQLARSLVLHNETDTSQSSISLRLVGVTSNRNGYAARVELVDHEPLIVRELSGGGSFQSAHANEIYLGIGDQKSVTIRIVWPSGTIDTHENISPGDWTAIEGGRTLRFSRRGVSDSLN